MADGRAKGIEKLWRAAALLGDAAGDDPIRSALRLVVDGVADVLEERGAAARPVLGPADVAALLECSEDYAYDVIKREMRHRKVGRLLRVSAEDFWTWFNGARSDSPRGLQVPARSSGATPFTHPRYPRGSAAIERGQSGVTRTLLSADDVAAELGCSKRRAYDIVREAGAQPVGLRAVRVTRERLDAWLAGQAEGLRPIRSEQAPARAARRDPPLIRPRQPRVRPKREDGR